MLATTTPYPLYLDLDGSPLDGGSIYFGAVNQNPRTSPITVYWDAAGTQPAAQPIRTLNGYAARNGTPAQVYAAGDYSIQILTRRGKFVDYVPSAAAISSTLALSLDLASTTDPLKGAGGIGFSYALGYAAGTLGRWVKDLALGVGSGFIGTQRTAVAGVVDNLGSWLEGTVISANQVGILPTNSSATNTTLLQALITVSPGRRIYFPGYAGTYSFGDLSIATGTHHWFGDGIEGTKFLYTGTGIFLNGEVATDVFLPRSPIYIDGIGFSGGTKSTQVGISLKNRHDYDIRNCSFDHFSTQIRLNTAYNGQFQNVTGTNCDTGWDIVGDVNNVKFLRCGVTDFATYGARVRPGTFGCIALGFDTCDLEFGTGACFRNETDDHIVLTNSYLGDGCAGNVFEIVSGQVSMSGGLALFGQQAGFTNRLVEFIGANPVTDERSLSLNKVKIGGGTFCGPSGEKAIKGTGSVYIDDCGIATLPTWSGAAVTIAGDPLGKKPGLNVLLSPHGRTFTGARTGAATFTAIPNLTTGSLFLQCTAGGGAGDVIYAYTSLQAGKLQTFGAAGAIIVYKSNAAFGVNLASLAGTFNTAPAVGMGAILPNTASVVFSMVVYGQTALAAAYSTLEIFRANCAIGDFIEIFEVYLFDERQYGAGGTLYAGKNLYKPI